MEAKDPVVYFVAGALSGITSVVLTCPIEVVKTRMQSSVHGNQGYLSLIKNMFQKEGPRSFYKGIFPSLAGVTPAKGIYFCTYSTTKRLLNRSELLQPNSSGIHMLSAGLAGFTTTTLTNPIWLVKTRLQINQSQMSTWDCVRKVYRNEGLRGFYKVTKLFLITNISVFMELLRHENFRSIISNGGNDSSLQFAGFMLAGGVSKIFACCLAYPHEVVRTRLREENSTAKGFFRTFASLYREGGYRTLYKGLTMQLVRSAPNSAITIGTYEVVVHYFNNSGNSRTQDLVDNYNY
ncbi:hypothetical protein M3Y97_01137500 [Aphelenchoides bicaudatus]|nr:hypothetical protein M3Y97_01137500 [Aphelenchoides bicaudatus]